MKNICKILFVILVCLMFNNDIKAKNVSCTYVMKEGSCGKKLDEASKNIYETGKNFNVEINIDDKELNTTFANSNLVIMNNNVIGLYLKNSNDEDVSAVDYYNKNKTCPPYFAIHEYGEEFMGYFSSEKTSLKCTYPIYQDELDKNLNSKEEKYSCTLYSEDPIYDDININVTINYTKKNLAINGISSEENSKKSMEEFEKSFDYTKKNVCPTGKLKACKIQGMIVVVPTDYDGLEGETCTNLTSSKKLTFGTSTCETVIDYIKKLQNNDDNYTQTYNLLKSFCASETAHSNYSNDEYSCLNLCLNIKKYLPNLTSTTINDCGLSNNIVNWIKNILKWIKYILPVLVIILGILDFIKAISSGSDDEMKKAQGRFVKRLIAAALLFIIPAIIEFVLTIFKIESTFCGIIGK